MKKRNCSFNVAARRSKYERMIEMVRNKTWKQAHTEATNNNHEHDDVVNRFHGCWIEPRSWERAAGRIEPRSGETMLATGVSPWIVCARCNEPRRGGTTRVWV